MLLRTHKNKPAYEVGSPIRRSVTISPSGNVRIDSWLKISRRDGIYVRDRFAKLSHFGKTFDKDEVYVNDYIYSEMSESGEVINFASSIKGHGSLNGERIWAPPRVYYSPDGNMHEGGSISNVLPIEYISELNPDFVREGTLHNNEFFPHEAEIFEDEINAPYILYGMAIAALSAGSFHIPYKANVVMDSSLGFNIPNIKLLPDMFDVPQDAIKKQVNDFVFFLGKINAGFQRLSAKHNVDMRVHGVIHPFGCALEIFDKSFPLTKFRSYVNNSDHCRMLRTLDAIDNKYMDSPLFRGMVESKIPSAVSSLFDDQDDRKEFVNGIITKHYVSVYD